MAENDLTRDEVDVIRAMADNDLNGSLAAKELFVSKSTIGAVPGCLRGAR